jgi:polar amino acid transport system substrate-binding protein
MKKFVLGAIGIAFIATFMYMKWKSPRVAHVIPDTLVIGTSADFQPFCFKEQGDIVGFDIDVAKEVARRLNKGIELRDIPFELLIPQLQLGTIHFVAACMTPTPERAQRVNFSQPYLTGDRLVVVSRSDTQPIKSMQDLTGKKVIVNQGYTADRYMSKVQGPELVRLPTVSDAVLALASKRADAFVTASKVIEPYFKQQGRDKFHVFEIPDIQESAALALSPLYPKLAESIDTVIQSMKDDGTIQALKEKWHLA